jgi:hypothetical protein
MRIDGYASIEEHAFNVLLPIVPPRMATSETAANEIALIEPAS